MQATVLVQFIKFFYKKIIGLHSAWIDRVKFHRQVTGTRTTRIIVGNENPTDDVGVYSRLEYRYIYICIIANVSFRSITKDNAQATFEKINRARKLEWVIRGIEFEAVAVFFQFHRNRCNKRKKEEKLIV